MAETNQRAMKAYSIFNITTTNVGNFELYRGQIYLRDQSGTTIRLSDFINQIRGFEQVTVDSQDKQGCGIHFRDIVGSKFTDIVPARIVNDKIKKILVEELINQEYVSVDGKTAYRFSRADGLGW